MEKKNTMLLTTIAVATLLITVVGATFAYFGVTLQNDSETVNITGSATDVGVITLTTPDSALHLYLTGTEMSYDNIGKTYATTSVEGLDYVVGSENGDLDDPNVANAISEVLNISVVGGDSNLTYTCEIDMNLQKTAKDTMFDIIEENYDAALMFGNEETFASSAVNIGDLDPVNGSIDLSTTITDLSASKPVSYYLTIGIVNDSEKQKFANTILDLEFKVNSIDCKINK